MTGVPECSLHDPEWWWKDTHISLAKHICVMHCPVFVECLRFTEATRDQWRHQGCVVAGEWFPDKWKLTGNNRARKGEEIFSHPSGCPICDREYEVPLSARTRMTCDCGRIAGFDRDGKLAKHKVKARGTNDPDDVPWCTHEAEIPTMEEVNQEMEISN